MKKLLLGAVFALSATGVMAQVAEAVPVPIDAQIMKKYQVSSGGDVTGAVTLLVLVGVVVATAAMAGRAKAEKDPYLLYEDDVDN